MAVVVLLSTMSFTISEHYCGDSLVDWALFEKAEDCGMEKQQPILLDGCSVQKDTCCNDVLNLIEGQHALKINTTEVSVEQKVGVMFCMPAAIELFEVFDTNIDSFNDYPPPLLVQDLQLLHEVFII